MSHPATRVLAALAEPTDAELLTRFVADRDAGAFELLVWRHAGLVLRVCRGVLRDYHAAEDATQAVFLALARQAASVGRSGSIAGWLFRVARRVAAGASRQRTVPTVPTADLDVLPAPVITLPDPDVERILHEEIARLPEPYRVLILLCFFEGLTHTEAARRLGVPVGTVAGQMARAKDALAARLTRRGVPLSLLAPVVVAVAPSFTAATTRAAVAFATRSCSGVPGPILELAERELRMTVAKKVLAAGAMAVAVCSCLALGLRSRAEPPAPPLPPARPAVPADKPAVQKPPAAFVGKTFAIAPVTTDLQRLMFAQGGANATVVVLLDGTPLFKDDKTLDVEAFNLNQLRKALKTFPLEKGKTVAHLTVHYWTKGPAGPNPSIEALSIVDFVLEGAARSVGFVPTNTRSTRHAGQFTFGEFIGPLKDDKGAEEAEDGVGDERARAYPVRTPLSKVLNQSMGGVVDVSVGGVVDVRVPLDCQGDDWLPAEVDKSVKAAIGKLKLAKGQRINFLFDIPKRDDRAYERVDNACKRWAEDSGLKMGSFSY